MILCVYIYIYVYSYSILKDASFQAMIGVLRARAGLQLRAWHSAGTCAGQGCGESLRII